MRTPLYFLHSAFTTLTLLLLVAGCKTVTPSRDNSTDGYIPEHYVSMSGSYQAQDRWWKTFGSDELNKLVERALTDNLSLAQAEARLRQSQAIAKKAGANRYPEVNLSASTAANRRRAEVKQADGTSSRKTIDTDTYDLGLAASYEVDLWGRVRSLQNAAALSAMASRQDLEAGAMTLVAQITELWLKQSEYRAQLTILEEQLKSNKTTLDLIRLRQRKSLASALDVYQQEQAVAATEALLPQVRSLLDVTLHQIAILTGNPPGKGTHAENHTFPAITELPDTGIPSLLLSQRPDIQAALLRLKAADNETAVAEADRMPALRLTGRYSHESESIDELFDNWLLNLAAGLTAPLLDGGRRQAEVDRAEALADERLAAYRETVLVAIREVEDALARERHQREFVQATEKELAAAQGALREARQRYRKGIINYLPVLQALTTEQRLQRAQITQHRQLLSLRVQLHRAVGGSWTRSLDFNQENTKDNQQ
ncbi:MAG: efflux transporter outer membrane subunit [Kiritimatiellae bacterium]|nr:efflux transporter outer membrane subunit [Kiritimatiellia bacterium]